MYACVYVCAHMSMCIFVKNGATEAFPVMLRYASCIPVCMRTNIYMFMYVFCQGLCDGCALSDPEVCLVYVCVYVCTYMPMCIFVKDCVMCDGCVLL